MTTAGCLFSILAGFFATLGAIPFLGWLNWITTLPLSILAILFSWLTLRDSPENGTARWGLIAGVILLFWSIFRLGLGAGLA